MQLDSDAYIRVCCYLKNLGQDTDKFSLSYANENFSITKWDYEILEPTEEQLMTIDSETLLLMKKRAMTKLTKITILNQKETEMFNFEEGDIWFNKTNGMICIWSNGKIEEI